MTEADWLACTDPAPMLEYLRGKASDRKLRLFAVACCWRVLHLLPDDVGCRDAINAAERFADDCAPDVWGPDAVTAAVASAASFAAAAAGCTQRTEAEGFAAHAAYACTSLTGTGYADDEAAVWSVAADAAGAQDWADRGELGRQGSLVRDIFGNPFRPAAFDSAWRTSTVFALAEATYAERTFDRLPILADALEDAGCDAADLLAHLRGGGPHVRGCWALDLVLGKE